MGGVGAGILGAGPFLAALVFAALISTTLTPLLARYASWRGLVVNPKADRWHRRPTPILGGVAMTFAVLLVLAVTLPHTPTFAALIVCAAGAAALGLLDDVRGLAPTTKLAGQVIIASLLVAAGIRVELVTFEPAAFVLTVGWIVALMNAVNLIDNMDGLAAGIAVIAGIALGVTATPSSPAAILAGTTAGAALGFLVHNFSPAKVFMGDAGSMLLGFLLGTAALLGTTTATTNVAIAVFGPLAMLALPIFDTALVSASRGLAGLPISRGGRDHASHRLVALGLTERSSVLLLYALAAALATLAIAAEFLAGLFLPLLVLAGIGLALFGVFLSEVNPYGEEVRPTRGNNAVGRAIFRYVRFGSEVLVDVTLLTVAYYISHVLRFEDQPPAGWLIAFGWSLPILVSFQVGALVTFRIYRTLWRYVGIGDALGVLRALLVANVLGFLAIALIDSSAAPSRAVFVLDWLLAGLLVVGARSLLVWLRQWFGRRPRHGERRVIIIGASDLGVLAHRLLGHQEGASYRTIGFLDDDRGKHYRQIGGVPVLGFTADLGPIARRLKPDLILDTGASSPGKVRETCRALDIEWRPFAIPALTTLESATPDTEAAPVRLADAARQSR